VIIARIIRALQLATTLEERLISGAAQWQLVPGRIVLPSPRKRPVGQPARRLASGIHARLDRMPTAAEIAADVRRRPVGVVIAELGRDFGIMPCHPLWRELSEAVMFNGGSLAALSKYIDERSMIAIRDPAFLPYTWPEVSSEGQEALPGLAALPAGWEAPFPPSLAQWLAPCLPSPAASGADRPEPGACSITEA
jgi:hypothetical protein